MSMEIFLKVREMGNILKEKRKQGVGKRNCPKPA